MAALAAESVGAMDEMLKLTVDYLKTRKQFGTTIGSFQVLQHRSTDMFMALEQARSMAMFAAMMAQDDESEGAPQGASRPRRFRSAARGASSASRRSSFMAASA